MMANRSLPQTTNSLKYEQFHGRDFCDMELMDAICLCIEPYWNRRITSKPEYGLGLNQWS